MPIVLKADGLALGKGVLICKTGRRPKDGVKTLMLDKQFGSAGDRIVVEEFMTGREVSVLSFVDGKTIKIMTSAQDHKRAKDGDQGLKHRRHGHIFTQPVLYGRGGRLLQEIHLSDDRGRHGGGGQGV